MKDFVEMSKHARHCKEEKSGIEYQMITKKYCILTLMRLQQIVKIIQKTRQSISGRSTTHCTDWDDGDDF
jgi:hypothetical protein